MDNLSDDARFSTQLEGKKLTGYGARLGKILNKFIGGSVGLGSGMELDNERGIHSEEIFFDDIGQEIEEKKKRTALALANKNIKEGQKLSALKAKKVKDAKDERSDERAEGTKASKEDGTAVSDPKKEIEQIRESAGVKSESLAEQKNQQEIAQGQKPAQEMQKNREAILALNNPELQQQPADLNVKAKPSLDNLLIDPMTKGKNQPEVPPMGEQEKAEPAPSHKAVDAIKSLLGSVKPVELPDVRGAGKAHGAPEQGAGGRGGQG